MTVIMLALGAISFLAPLSLARARGLVPFVSPMHFVAYFAFFGILLKTVSYAINPNLAFFTFLISDDISIGLGYIYITLFVLAICAGYLVGCRPRNRQEIFAAARESVNTVRHRSLLLPISIGIFSLSVMALLSARGLSGLSVATFFELNNNKAGYIEGAEGFGRTFAGLKTLFIVPKLVFVIFAARFLVYRNKSAGIAVAVSGLILVLTALLSGDRMELIDIVIFYFCTHFALGHTLNAGTAFKMLFGACFVFVFFIFMSTARTVEYGTTTTEFSLIAALAQIVNSTYFLDVNVSILVIDLSDIDDWFLGETYLWWTFGWVPRDFWPGKPAMDVGVFLKRDILGLYAGGAINVTGPGEAYLNFGWFGALCGTVLGFMYRRFEEFLLEPRRLRRGLSLLLYPVVFYPFIQSTLQSSFSAFVVGAAAQLVLIYLFMWPFLKRVVRTRRVRRSVRSPIAGTVT